MADASGLGVAVAMGLGVAVAVGLGVTVAAGLGVAVDAGLGVAVGLAVVAGFAAVIPLASSHEEIVALVVPAAKRCPSSQRALGARTCKLSSLVPMGLEPEVQKGRMVLPEKS